MHLVDLAVSPPIKQELGQERHNQYRCRHVDIEGLVGDKKGDHGEEIEQ